MKKRYIALLAIALAAVLAYFLSPSLETIVQKLVNKYASQVTGTDVSLQGFKFSPLKGEGTITKILVANPKGYKSPYVFQLDQVSIKVDVKSLTTDTIVVDYIYINKPIITYEMISLTQNNLKQLQENIAKNTVAAAKEEAKPEAKPEAKKAKAESKPAKKIIIKKFVLRGATIEAGVNVLNKVEEKSVIMPELVLTNLGANHETPVQIISKVLNKIVTEASQTVINSGMNNLKAVARENLDKVVNDVKEKVNLKGLFKQELN